MSNYDPKSMQAGDFINHEEILATLTEARTLAQDPALVRGLLDKAAGYVGLTHREAAVLLEVQDPLILAEVFGLARKIKEHIYGRRIVMFAPLYLADYCVNQCSYCGYNHDNCIPRRKLNATQLEAEVRELERMGHKRLALEAGEDPVNVPIDYIIDCIHTIYDLKFENGAIRRVNVNIAATTVEDYRRLKDAAIGTYVLFQETYHKPTYRAVHKGGPKRNYEYHTEAHDRAMQGGIEDVGLGVLYGLYDWKYDTVGMLMHAEHLEAALGVGPHTLSIPRIRSAAGMAAKDYPNLVSDTDFRKVVAVLRLAVPYTGMLLSTREPQGYRDELITLGISQMSAGSCTGVGGYADENKLIGGEEAVPQFEPEDHRSPTDFLKSLLRDGYIPSFCTACYREGRTGDRFMQLVKSGQIANCCQPNALMTLKEYLEDYAAPDTKQKGEALIARELLRIPNEKVRAIAAKHLTEMQGGRRDFRF